MSASTMFNDTYLDEGPPRSFYCRRAFWKAAVPVILSLIALIVAITLQLHPKYHFKTKVPPPLSPTHTKKKTPTALVRLLRCLPYLIFSF